MCASIDPIGVRCVVEVVAKAKTIHEVNFRRKDLVCIRAFINSAISSCVIVNIEKLSKSFITQSNLSGGVLIVEVINVIAVIFGRFIFIRDSGSCDSAGENTRLIATPPICGKSKANTNTLVDSGVTEAILSGGRSSTSAIIVLQNDAKTCSCYQVAVHRHSKLELPIVKNIKLFMPPCICKVVTITVLFKLQGTRSRFNRPSI
mmetsp:Transcript_10377/g.21363  ORF Transcript_10377/g.21363 Transcript_10377/m.21363 type:complete len:204 (+) Transcript_10377:487-1098(+)